jgi:hypothetical protein
MKIFFVPWNQDHGKEEDFYSNIFCGLGGMPGTVRFS